MDQSEIILLIWLVLGIINISLLYYIIKRSPNNVYIGKGWLYEIGLLLIWFSFAFIIIPYFLLQFARKYLALKLNTFNENLKKKIKK